MRKLKAYIAVVLLIMLAPVVIPRDVWHHHSDEPSSAPPTGQHTDTVTRLCDLCKVQATVFTASVPAPLPQVQSYPVEINTPGFAIVHIVPICLLPQRAPPIA